MQGAAYYAEQFELLYRREASRPNEMWQADHTPLDAWVFDELEHLLFFVTGVPYWWPVVHPVAGPRRLGFGAALMYVFAALLHSNLLGAALALAKGRLSGESIAAKPAKDRVSHVCGRSADLAPVAS